MKKPNYTKGPWKVIKYQSSSELAVYEKANSIDINKICDIEHGNYANAHLIAAAPEMLEALEHLNKELCEGDFVKHSADAIRKIKDAIKKARGEA